MRGAIARPEREDEPGDQIVLCTAAEFFDTIFFDRNLPEAGKQIYYSPHFHVSHLLYNIPNVWDGKATPLLPLVESAEVDHEAEFVTPRFGDRKTR